MTTPSTFVSLWTLPDASDNAWRLYLLQVSKDLAAAQRGADDPQSATGQQWVDPVQIAAVKGRLAACLVDLERYDEAEPLLTASLGTLRSAFGDSSAETVRVRELLTRLDKIRAAGS